MEKVRSMCGQLAMEGLSMIPVWPMAMPLASTPSQWGQQTKTESKQPLTKAVHQKWL